MTEGQRKTATPADLRRRAEEMLQRQSDDLRQTAPEDLHDLIHELQVHQVELEMQNEELRRTQRELEQARDKYSDLYNFAPVGYLTLSESGTILQTNLTAARMLGVDRNRLVGRPLTDFVSREDQDVFYLHRRQILNSQKPQMTELRVEREDGARLWVRMESAPTDGGDQAAWRAAISDVTKRKRAEQALRESEKRFRALVTASTDVVYRLSPDWSEMRELRGQDFLADAEGPSGTWLQNYILPEDRPHVARAIDEATRNRSLFELEHRVRRADGTVGWAQTRAVPLLDEEGKIVEWFGASSDITERKRANKMLVEAERMAAVGRMGISLAHEINNPLQSVIGCLGLAAEAQEDDEEEAAHLLDVAQEEVVRAASIVSRLRDLTRPGDERTELADIGRLIEKTVTVTHQKAKNQRVEVIWQGGDDLPRIPMKPDRIQQVVLNLVLNAIDAMPDGGELRIEAAETEEPPGVEVAFTDTGVGIPSDELDHLFEPFGSNKPEGAGLGLYVTHNIVREHGGWIAVDTEVGEGTTFTIWLPQENDSDEDRT